jgi:hypothetical protein
VVLGDPHVVEAGGLRGGDGLQRPGEHLALGLIGEPRREQEQPDPHAAPPRLQM